jgi:peptidoglycan DL-endopeptidase RipA
VLVFGEADRPGRGTHRSRKNVLTRLTACGAAAVSLAVCVYVAPAHAAPKPPPNPTDQQLSAAAQQKRALAQAVGVLSAQIAQAQARLQTLRGQAELAEQKFAFAVSKLNDAKEQAARAQAAVLTAQQDIDKAHAELTSYVRDSYMSPPVSSTTIDLLTAADPTALLQGGDYQGYISSHHLDAMGKLNRATVAKSNADAKAKSLLKLQQQLTLEAQQAQQAAEAAYAAEQAEAGRLRSSLASYQKQLAAAQLQLAILNNQRANYLAYQRRQAEIAAAKARAAALARQRAAEAAAEARRRNRGGGSSSGGGGSSSGGGDNTPLPPAGSQGSWSAGKGRAAANRALRWLGQPYSWAAGNYNGPTYGVDSPGTDGWNDSTVYGFDCSGLALYAWAPQGIYLPHYAASQYYTAGSYHPSPGNFMPGDLLFWSTGGADGIHHVAIYIGNGNVVQAPNSGDVVKVTPWDQVDWGYYGATRPLT